MKLEDWENNNALAKFCESIDGITAAVKEIAEIDHTERGKHKPHFSSPLSPRRYPSFKLRRKNKALFRPCHRKRQRRGNKNTGTKREANS